MTNETIGSAIPNPAPDGPGPMKGPGAPGMLDGIRVVEIADEQAEYVGLMLAGLGAEVIKVEPPGGSPTRAFGPFHGGMPHPERSIHFWQFNRGKQSVVLDWRDPASRPAIFELLGAADVLVDSTQGALHRALGLSREALQDRFPLLVQARMTPFGDDGPYAGYKACDLVHLALGGIMMNCGYDTDPTGRHDLPPIAPQMWHAYQIAGDHLVIGVMAALLAREHTGRGQDVNCAVHEAVSKNTELDVVSWIMRRAPLFRQTCRHASEHPGYTPNISHTKDGRWYVSWSVGARDMANLAPFLGRYGMAADLVQDGDGADHNARNVPGTMRADERSAHVQEVIQRFVRSYRYEDMPWQEAQEAGLLWAPLRKPHENAVDSHWLERRSYADVPHPELGRTFRYATSKWLSTATSWRVGKRAPRVGEHTLAVLDKARTHVAVRPAPVPRAPEPVVHSRLGRPFPLQGIRIFDFSWFLASAGGTRFLASLGAEVIKVEWKDNPDTRLAAMAPVGGREARSRATAPLPGVTDPDMGGNFNLKNAGKLGLSLNVRDPRGMEIARALIRQSDIVAEGFSPGVLERWGLGYEALKALRNDIIYIQQSGMGAHGTYGRLRTVGPVAAAFAGTSEMSGLPEPAMPAGWGYSYLDWIGAHTFAIALLGALHHRHRTGEGQWIDSSQCEAGLFLAGGATLDWSANGTVWQRQGNRSRGKPAAPHGAFRCAGEDRWIAIACFDDAEFAALAAAAGQPGWAGDPRFATLAARLANQDALEALVGAWTVTQEAYACMHSLQAVGVPAGVCQNAQDRCEHDPQLAHLQWLTEITGTKIGTWPVPGTPVRLADTPSYAGGPINRGAPCYGEDNAAILSRLLGMSGAEIEALARDGVI